MDNLVLYHCPDCLEEAQRFSSWCKLVSLLSAPKLPEGYALWLDDIGLGLCVAGHNKPFRIASENLAGRARGPSLLVSACGQASTESTLLDPYAGFGLDALLLAERGFSVTMVEQNLAVWLLLNDFIDQQGSDIRALHGRAETYLADGSASWDVVYLDPMFPQRKKKALPNLGLQMLQAITDSDEVDLKRVLSWAQQRARRRVVLKRRAKDDVIGKPNHQLHGKAVRFDVYV